MAKCQTKGASTLNVLEPTIRRSNGQKQKTDKQFRTDPRLPARNPVIPRYNMEGWGDLANRTFTLH